MRGFKTVVALIQVAILHEPSEFLKEIQNLQIQNLPNRCRFLGFPRLYNFAFVSSLKTKAEKTIPNDIRILLASDFRFFHTVRYAHGAAYLMVSFPVICL